MIVYKLTFANGKSYIGQTVRSLAERVAEHRKSSNRLLVARAWARHGDPVVEIIATGRSQGELNEAEIRAIAEHGTVRPGGYNICIGGQNSPTCDPEVARRVGDKLKGRIFSPEARARMSAAAKARTRGRRSPETRAKMVARAKGYWASATDATVAERAIAVSRGLRGHYDSMTPEERSAMRKRAWATRRSREQGAVA